MNANTNTNVKVLHRLAIIFSLFASCALLIELYLLHRGTSLCQSSACAIVSRFVRLGEPVLVTIGAIFFFLLAGLMLFAGRYPSQPLVFFLPILTLIGASAFDGTLLGFQFVTIRQYCQMCITVATLIAIITSLYAAALKRWALALSCLTVWLAGFAGSAILIMPDTTEPRTDMAFYERPATGDVGAAFPQATLIFSLKCPHCAEVLEELAKQNPTAITWRFALTDETPDAYGKLGLFYANLPATGGNPFQLLLDAKRSDTLDTDRPELSKLPPLTRQARLFLANNGIHSIPVLVYKESVSKSTIITGSQEILAFLRTVNPL